MRSVPSDIASKLSLKKQTRANKADPSASIWIGRPTTALTTDVFLERQEVLAAPITDVAIAVAHPRIGAANTDVYLAYVSDGKAKVIAAVSRTKIDNHIWGNTGFEVDADVVSMAFDGSMPKVSRGGVEFITEPTPWIFWIKDQVLYARKLDGDTPIVLAETNCIDVSAVRAMWSEVGDFDFGLVCFFILNGQLFYRQLIRGEWLDAEAVTFGPAGITWAEVAAFRTWDYRVGVQLKGTDGKIYEMFTQFMGIGKQMTEHIEVRGITAAGKRTRLYLHEYKENEHIEIASVQGEGLYQWGTPVFGIAAANIDDGFGNWGKVVTVVLDHPCGPATVPGSGNRFSITGSNNATFYSESATCSVDGLTLTIIFADFNAALGECTLAYTPGSIKSPLINPATDMLAWTFDFEPINLEPPAMDPPEVVEVYNT